MTTEQVLFGVGLILVLAVGSQVLASFLRIPSLIVLLPVGFTAGALTSDISPERLLGAAFEPLVALAVALILYDAGTGLDLSRLDKATRRVVSRLIVRGVPVTWAFAGLSAVLLLHMSSGAALMTGAILVVSGPTVVQPLLDFARPAQRLRRVLAWEGSLIDPVGGILGAVVYSAVIASASRGLGYQAGQFLLTIGIGLAGAAIGIALLWLLLRVLHLGQVLSTTSQLATVVAVAAVCDIARPDAGLLAALVMGMALANIRGFDIPDRRPFAETLVQLIIGILFITISATIPPASLRHLELPTLGLVAVLVLIARPLVAFVATAGMGMTRGERAFIGWMDPRGIVAASTASTFAAGLVAHHVGGAAKILPVTFMVIVATVAIYGLTAVPAARRLGVTRPARSRPLLIGGQDWVIDLARQLRSAGLSVLMWSSSKQQRAQIQGAGLDLVPGELVAAATGSGAELEGITAVLLLTAEDDFNALAAEVISGRVAGPVYRLAPARSAYLSLASDTSSEVLFGPERTSDDISHRYAAGARVHSQPAGAVPGDSELLCVVRADGQLMPVTAKATPPAHDGDTMILFGPADRRSERGG